MTVDARPFTGARRCWIALPESTGDPFAAIDQFRALLIAESAELEAELGCPVTFGEPSEPLSAEDGLFLVGPITENWRLQEATRVAGRAAPDGPIVWRDDQRQLVAVDGPTIGDVGSAFQLLRTFFRTGLTELAPTLPGSVESIVDTLAIEVAETWPSFALRGIDWAGVLDRHRSALVESEASLPELQRLFSELQDAHTWVRDGSINARFPYRTWVEPGSAYLVDVPEWSAAWAHGVRPGDRVLEVDSSDWWERTAATPRARAAVAGYRWLGAEAGSSRSFRVSSRDGGIISWDETCPPVPWNEIISWRVLDSGTGYLDIRGWQFTREWFASLDRAFSDLGACPRLLVDIRGNVGGQLIAAQAFRDRFLPGPTDLGWVQFSIGDGRLAPLALMTSRPDLAAPGWTKPVRFLVDRQTYSASEDAILGLAGLPHVQVVGEATGGGSGRPRTIPLREGVSATISTALTFDREMHCIEANGVPVDVELPIAEWYADPLQMPANRILELADRDWFG